MKKKCTFKKVAVYEIEFITNPPHGLLVYVWEEHFPEDSGIIDPIDKVKKIG